MSNGRQDAKGKLQINGMAASPPLKDGLCGIDQAAIDYNDDMDRLEKTLDLNAKPISERERERLINRSCGD